MRLLDIFYEPMSTSLGANNRGSMSKVVQTYCYNQWCNHSTIIISYIKICILWIQLLTLTDQPTLKPYVSKKVPKSMYFSFWGPLGCYNRVRVLFPYVRVGKFDICGHHTALGQYLLFLDPKLNVFLEPLFTHMGQCSVFCLVNHIILSPRWSCLCLYWGLSSYTSMCGMISLHIVSYIMISLCCARSIWVQGIPVDNP